MDINEAKAFLKSRINPNMIDTILSAGRGEGGNMFHITLTNTGTYAEPIWTCDKTYEEINNAYPNIDCTVIDLDGHSGVCQLPIREEGYIYLKNIMVYGSEISGLIVMFSSEEDPYVESFYMTVGSQICVRARYENGSIKITESTPEEGGHFERIVNALSSGYDANPVYMSVDNYPSGQFRLYMTHVSTYDENDPYIEFKGFLEGKPIVVKLRPGENMHDSPEFAIGGEKLIVNATRNGNTWSFDKTADEIIAAGLNSEVHVADTTGYVYVCPLTYFTYDEDSDYCDIGWLVQWFISEGGAGYEFNLNNGIIHGYEWNNT